MSRSNAVSRSNEPMRVYKVLGKDRNGKYRTPYRYFIIDDDVINGERNFVASGVLNSRLLYPFGSNNDVEQRINGYIEDGYRYMIEKGLIHCYTRLKDALNDLALKEYLCFKEYSIFEVEIPAGTGYIEGKFGYSLEKDSPLNGCPCICAREIKFIKKIDVEIDGQYLVAMDYSGNC